MASEAGGRADKLGNEFERLWAVRHIIELLSERATSVLIEPSGDDERGTEFWVGRPDGTREAHQCKRENGTVGNWSAADLETKKVISNAAFQLRRDPSHCYFFVSGDKVTHVYDLTERARSYENPAVFRAEALTSSGHQRDFQTICRVLALHPDEPADLLNLFDILRRLHFRIADKEGLRNDVEELAHRWIDGDPRIAVAALKDLADKSIGRTLRVDDVISHLAALSIRPRDLATDLRLRPALHELRARFARSYCHLLIGGATLGRRETYDILELLNAPDGPRLILGHGSGGDGKSGVGFELNGLLAEAGVVCLPLRLDRDRPADSPRQYGQSLDLPASPAACLAAAANGQSGVLLLDQVDALRWTAAHSSHAWDTVERLVAEALNYPNLRVVLMCRSFDTEENPRIKAWKERTKAIPFRIGPLDDTIVDRVAATVDVSAASIDAAQRRVLRSPQGLYLFWRVMQGPGVRPPAFRTMTDLMRKFWELVRAEKLPDLLPGQYDLALGTLVRYMDAHGTLTAPMSCVTQWPKEIQALQSMNVLVKDARGRLLFAHQSYLDYLTAERVLHEVQSGKGSVMDWLRTHDQSLFRRGQLRQLLALLRDDDPSVYAHSLRSILVGDSVRFHLRHLALQLLGHADPPENSEVALVLDLAKDNAWLYHLSSHVLVDRPSWFDALNDRGVVRAWLNGMDEKRRKFAFGMLERVLPNRGNIVEPLLLEGTRDKAWRERFEAVVWRTSPEKLTGPLFGVYVRLVRRGSRLIHFVDWKQLAVARPKRFVRLLKACLERDERNRRKRPRAMKKWLDRSSLLVGETLQAAANAAAIAPAEMWDRLLPLLRNALSETRALQRRRYKGDFHRDHIRQQHIGRILRLTRTVLVAAGRALAATARGAFWSRIDALKDMKAASISRVLIRSITAGSDDYADAAIRWLLANPSRLHCGAGGRGATYRPARALLLRYAALCSEGTFAELQARILAYWPKRERWTFECRRRKYVGADVASVNAGLDIFRHNELGLGQHLLLSALPPARLAPSACDQAGVLYRKFGTPKPLLKKQKRGMGGWVGSVIPDDRLHLLSDRDWLRIISGKCPQPSTEWKQMGPGKIGEHSLRAFSGAIGSMTRRQPRRFARLAMRMPFDVHPTYPMAILQALDDAMAPEKAEAAQDWEPATSEEVGALIKRFEHMTADREFALVVCRAYRHDRGGWDTGMLERLSRLAIEHRDPQPGEFSVSRPMPIGTAKRAGGGPDVPATAINCVREAAAFAIQAVLFHQPDKFLMLRPAIDKLVADPHPAVRHASFAPLLPMLNIDREQAVAFFLQACSHPDDVVLRSHDVNQFLSYTLPDELPRLRPVIDRMVASDLDVVSRAGAAWATQLWTYNGALADVVSACKSGRAPQRQGVAESIATFIAEERGGEEAAVLLATLFDDESEDVRNAAAAVFRNKDLFGQSQAADLAERFARSRGFADHADDLLWGLDDFTGLLRPYAAVLRAIVDRFVRGPAATVEPHFVQFPDSGTLAKLLLRLYEQAEGDPELRRTCLDAWDRLLEDGLWFDVLKHIDE